MKTKYTIEDMDRIADEIRSRISVQPEIGLILGSGLGPAVGVDCRTQPSFHIMTLPGWPISTVEGHAGELVIGNLEGKDVLVMNGRIHFYEGYEMSQVTLPIRVMQRLGIEIIDRHQCGRRDKPGLCSRESNVDHRSLESAGHGRCKSSAWSKYGRIWHSLPGYEPGV